MAPTLGPSTVSSTDSSKPCSYPLHPIISHPFNWGAMAVFQGFVPIAALSLPKGSEAPAAPTYGLLFRLLLSAPARQQHLLPAFPILFSNSQCR